MTAPAEQKIVTGQARVGRTTFNVTCTYIKDDARWERVESMWAQFLLDELTKPVGAKSA